VIEERTETTTELVEWLTAEILVPGYISPKVYRRRSAGEIVVRLAPILSSDYLADCLTGAWGRAMTPEERLAIAEVLAGRMP